MSIKDALDDIQSDVTDVYRMICASIVERPVTDALKSFLAALVSVFLGVVTAGILVPLILAVKLARWIAGKIRGGKDESVNDDESIAP
jgi:hypothetical protein